MENSVPSPCYVSGTCTKVGALCPQCSPVSYDHCLDFTGENQRLREAQQPVNTVAEVHLTCHSTIRVVRIIRKIKTRHPQMKACGALLKGGQMSI